MGEVVQNAVNEANRKIVEDQRPAPCARAEDRSGERPGRGRARHGGRGRPRLHGRGRNPPDLRDRDRSTTSTLERQVAEVSEEDVDAAIKPHGRPEPPLRRPRRARTPQVENGRPRHHRFRGPDRRRGVRGRQGRGRRRRHRIRVVHPGLRRPADRRQARRGAQGRGHVPGELHVRRCWPARTPSSTSRSRPSRRPGRSASTTSSPRASASTRSRP